MDLFYAWLKKYWWAIALGALSLLGMFLLGKYVGKSFWDGLNQRIEVKLADSTAEYNVGLAKSKVTGEAEREKLNVALSVPVESERRKAVAELLKDL